MRFDSVDLSRLPAPAVVEVPDYLAIVAERKADIVARVRAVDTVLADALEATLAIEGELIAKLTESGSYREVIHYTRVNDAAQAVMLAKAHGSDLEHLGALYKVLRQPGELDSRLRERIQGAPEALSTCGPPGAYVHHAKRAAPTVKDVATYTDPGTGRVHVLPLVSTDNGTPTPAVLEAIREAISADDTRPLTDIPIVRAPAISSYDVGLKLIIKRGPDAALIKTLARQAVEAYCASRHQVGEVHYLDGMTAAARVGGVETVIPLAPLADLVPARDAAFFCASVTISAEVIG